MGIWRKAPDGLVPVRLGAGPGNGAAGGAARRNKFRAIPTVAADGRRFASKAEAYRYEQLLLLQRAGLIEALVCQPVFRLPVNGTDLKVGIQTARYTADFAYTDAATRERVIEDVKGMMTPDARLRIALAEHVHGFKVRIVKVSTPKKRR